MVKIQTGPKEVLSVKQLKNDRGSISVAMGSSILAQPYPISRTGPFQVPLRKRVPPYEFCPSADWVR
ncbi:hypothetical protein WJX75_006845 [Coccomyxa subellipsoidea]|uniref:Uncharacterized protein n=1 Tax=Coccomyxa subellipsoidea TaxID=248742 RepID=A0ABR2Z3L4_9CHLO